MIKVYGDIMLDRWIQGSITRISPEAPVPVLYEEELGHNAGGAANLALNIKSLGNNVELYGACSDDQEGKTLISLLDLDKVHLDMSHSVTTTKTRLVDNSGQHVCRWDREQNYTKPDLLEQCKNDLQKDDILCVSDYAKGVVQRSTILQLRKYCETILVDPKQEPEMYTGATVFKPNIKYWNDYFGALDLEEVPRYMKKYEWKWLVLTCGAAGIYVFNSDGKYRHFQEPVREVADVTGAGDTVLAVIAHCMSQGMDVYRACEFACYAAARMVERRGVGLVTVDDLVKGVVFTNGVFDILHTGHFKLLEAARNKGSKLIIGINTDDSVKRLKGESRPVNTLEKRISQLEMLPWVDEIIPFEEDTPLELIKGIRPDLIVKGGDYTVEQVVGYEYAPVYIVPTEEGYSTTDIIKKSNENISNRI